MCACTGCYSWDFSSSNSRHWCTGCSAGMLDPPRENVRNAILSCIIVVILEDTKTHGLRVRKESAMKAIGVAFAYVLRTAPLGQLESGNYLHFRYLKASSLLQIVFIR
ncbi:hypothetical protein Tco_0808099 [Tanacetum coccineum]